MSAGSTEAGHTKAEVYLNNILIGFTKDPYKLVKEIRELRRKGVIPGNVNVVYIEEENAVYINADKGRLRRPLIVVKDGKPLLTKEHIEKLQKGELTWDDLVEMGVIEYLDAAEEEDAYIALFPWEVTKEHTHLEIHPIVILGTTASLIPFIEHNHAPKSLHGAKTIKQGVGIYFANFHCRMDTNTNIAHYVQVPLVYTLGDEVVKTDKYPYGMNVVVAILEYEGYNMQDALIINKGSLERGLFRSTYFKIYETTEMRYPGGIKDKIEIPPKDVVGYRGDYYYRHLETDGIIYPEAEVKGGDVLVGKTSPPRFMQVLEELRRGIGRRRDTSLVLKREEEGIVDTVILTEDSEGNKLVRIKIRDTRVPEIGDKFTSKYGQKGVIGMIVPHENMPFTRDGIVPDIIFSPHSIPSRMTVSHLLELLAGKVAALRGERIDGTSWDHMDVRELRKLLLEMGFRDDGTEVLYDGITGEEYKVRIFIGSMYYMRLHHQVKNKMHVRSRGPVALLTRQPTEGRAREGGLRMGEMEQECLVAHGASLLLKERFSSDVVKVPVCTKCGLVAIYDHWKDKTRCPIHGEDAEIVWVEMPYAFKLFLDELISMCIYPKLIVKPKV